MQPVGTKSAASFSNISDARLSRWFTVGSSPYTSSPTLASAIARRISAVGWVTVSLRKSTTPSSRLITSGSLTPLVLDSVMFTCATSRNFVETAFLPVASYNQKTSAQQFHEHLIRNTQSRWREPYPAALSFDSTRP